MRLLLALTLPVTSLFGVPVAAPLTLVEGDPALNRLALTVTPPAPLPARTDTAILTTEPEQPIIALLNIDPSTGTTSELSLTEGRIVGSDTSFTGGDFFSSYTIQLSNLGGRVFTPSPPAPVDPSTGSFDASLHGFEIDQGSVTGSVRVFLATTPIETNFTPGESVAGTGVGTGTVTLTETGSSDLSKSFDVVASLPVDITEVTDANGQPVTVRAVGTINMTGSVTVSTDPYLAWTIENGIEGAGGNADSNGDGVPNGIAWALGYDAQSNASVSLPRLIEEQPGWFQIQLPPNGTAAPITLLSSQDLVNENPIDPNRLSNLANPIPAGSLGTITIEASSQPREFIRMRSNE
ncbi:MAG: hypothetical protein ACPG4K_10765 [Haloferula sp.]